MNKGKYGTSVHKTGKPSLDLNQLREPSSQMHDDIKRQNFNQFDLFHIDKKNTSLAVLGALAHSLQRRIACNDIYSGH